MNDTLPQTLNPACDMQTDIPPRPTWLKRKPTRTTEAAERAAHKYNVNPGDVLALMPEALALIRRDAELIELARGRARQLTGLDARIIASRENKYLDHSTHPRFDETSRELAAEFPELGFNPDDHETPARVWTFIAEGKQPTPCRHSDCVAELAASWCAVLETEDFPDDADGFDPSSWEETATPSEISDLNPASYIQGTPCLPSQLSVPIAESPLPVVQMARDRQMDGNWKTGAPSATRVLSLTLNASLTPLFASERNRYVDENPSRHVPMQTSRDRPPCRDGIRRTTPRPIAGGHTLPGVRPQHLARPLVRPDRTGRGTGSDSVAIPRLGRVAGYNPVYVAGNGLPAFIRARDGPAMTRYPVSVA